MARTLILTALLLATTPMPVAQDRDPRLHVVVRVAQGAPPGTADAVPDVEEALGRARQHAAVRPATPGAKAELELWLTSRMMWVRGSHLASDQARSGADHSGAGEARALVMVIQAQAVAGRASHPIKGSGSNPKGAAQDLVAALERDARERQQLLLRSRPDWPDPGFDFEALTKERRKELRMKAGAAIVTAVRPGGPAQQAGLFLGDVLLRAGGQELGDAADLASALYVAAPGTRLDLEVTRGRERRTVTLTTP